MWQDDIVTLQTKTVVNNLGSEDVTWSDSETVVVDLQEINKEIAFRNWGFGEETEYAELFDTNDQPGNWVKGNQCKYNGEQWWIRLVDGQMDKIGASNHVFIVLSKVV